MVPLPGGGRWPPDSWPEPRIVLQAAGVEVHQEPEVVASLWTGSRVGSGGGFRAGGAGRLLGGLGCTKMATPYLNHGAPSSARCNRRSSDPSWPALYTPWSGDAAADEPGMDQRLFISRPWHSGALCSKASQAARWRRITKDGAGRGSNYAVVGRAGIPIQVGTRSVSAHESGWRVWGRNFEPQARNGGGSCLA